MIDLHRKARRAAQWVVDSVMGNGLSQQESGEVQDGSTSEDVARLCRQAAAEGCVLLVNDGTLPLSPTSQVAVFGRCQLDWFAMGYGSGGSVKAPYTTNLIDGLEDANAAYDRVLAEVYRSWCSSDKNMVDEGWWGHWPTSHPEMPVSEELAQAAASSASTALVVIGRNAGEDLDLPLRTGGYYLTEAERAMLDVVTSTFKHTVVVLNTSNAMDLQWIEEYDARLSAVLLAWQGGMEAGNAVADVLYGRINPSGCLACTVARTYEDYPSSTTFGKIQVSYEEGIYVGYRHFDARAPQNVLFGFGHGLSYTTFQLWIRELTREGIYVRARVRVTNTGSRAGKKAVLLWCEPPQDKVQKPVRVLAAFGKTGVIEPGMHEEIELVCDMADVSSFDADSRAFVLEAGSYQFDCTHTASGIDLQETVLVQHCKPICEPSDALRERIAAALPQEVSAGRAGADGTDANDKTADANGVHGYKSAVGSANWNNDVTACERDGASSGGNANRGVSPESARSNANANPGTNRSVAGAAGGNATASWSKDAGASNAHGNKSAVGSANGNAFANAHGPGASASSADNNVSFSDVASGNASLDQLVAQLSDSELEALTCGQGTMNSPLGAPGNAGAFGGVTEALRSRGIPAAICADGPSGARLQRRCSLLPSATTLASTWNTQLVQELYAAVGAEVRECGVDVLLAPGLNIQRDPRCGRNFEYFSEDPVASGLMAAAVVNGLKDAGISACPKHFACNNQERRRNTSDSRVSEQALREIYLRGFDICLRESQPDLIMTSYNKVNGVWAHYSYDLATTVLRNEWGFEGVVITDWWMRPARSPEFPELRNNAYRLRAGVDVLMPGSMSHVLNVHERPAGITRAELQRTARRVLRFLLRSAT